MEEARILLNTNRLKGSNPNTFLQDNNRPDIQTHRPVQHHLHTAICHKWAICHHRAICHHNMELPVPNHHK